MTAIEAPLKLLDEATARDPRFARAFAEKALIRANATAFDRRVYLPDGNLVCL